MKRLPLSAHIVIILLLLTACGGNSKTSSLSTGGAAITMRHAEYLSLEEHAGYTLAHVRNPWDSTGILHTYILIDKAEPLPDHLPKGTVVRTPIERSIVYSGIHGSLLKELGALESIAGVCDLSYILLPDIHERHRQGKIMDAGDSMSPDMERIIDLHPDAILLSPFENSGGYGQVEKLGIPLIECADYMETSPLGRAEWMRFFGRLVNRAVRADSLFTAVEESYLALKGMTDTLSHRPTLISDLKSSSTWYMPGGRSTLARLYADAGAEYVFADDTRNGSIPLSFETVFDKGENATFWLIKYNFANDKTYSGLKREYAPYASFRAFREHRVYGCNTGKAAYYEETPFRPDRLLKDLIKVFHPELVEGYEPVYFKALKE